VRTPDLTYEKWGTRIAVSDEGNERLQRFAFDGTKATAEAKGWELLQGCFERKNICDCGCADGTGVAYLWPIIRAVEGIRVDLALTASRPNSSEVGR
jgi:hypothetical protein